MNDLLIPTPKKLALPIQDRFKLIMADSRLHDALRRTPTYHGALLSVYGEDMPAGTNERADVIFQTLDGADMNGMWAEFQATLRIWAERRDALVNYLTFKVTNPIELVRYPSQENFEEATEYGEPVGIRLGPGFTMGYDFRWYDLAIRYTWQFVIESTQTQVEALNNEALEADERLMFNKVFKTLFNALDLTASVRDIPVSVYKFWNGDGMVPPIYKNYTFDGTHNHYLTSGAATLATAAITAIEDTLYHHGYSVTNGYRLVLLVNRQEGKVIRGARVTGGWGYDFIPGPGVGGGVYLPGLPIQIVAQPSGGAGIPGEIGTYGPFHVVEEDYIPPGYVVALASGGGENLGNPIGIREHENAAVRGLKLIPGDSEYPLKDSFYRHGFGSGIRHRGGGVVMQVTTNGTYTIPALYA